MEEARISVIIPVYKVEPYLKKCVDSVRAQTYENLEILLVNDGSPDNCGAMCDEYAAQDDRIRVIHKENGGLSDARNAGLDVATGDCIGFVDSDDWIEPEMYETLLELMRKCDADIACCNVIHVHSDGRTAYSSNDLECTLNLDRSEALKELLQNDRITNFVWQKLYRRPIFADLRFQKGITYEDADLMYRLLDRANRVAYTGKPLYNYLIRPGSISHSGFTRNAFYAIDSRRNRMVFYRDHDPQHYVQAQISYVRLACAILVWARVAPQFGRMRRAYWQELMRIVRKNPFLYFRAGGGWSLDRTGAVYLRNSRV